MTSSFKEFILNKRRPHRSEGFTLMELAIVLVIVALLIGGMMVPFSAQTDSRNINESQKALVEIKEALFGYAIINGKLPCPMPTTVTDPTDATYGYAAATCAPGVEGYLPWKTLGVREVDAWGSPRTATSDPFNGYWRYRLDAAFSTNFALTTAPTSAMVVKDASGNNLTVATESPVAVIFSAGPDLVASGRNGDATLDEYQGGERSSTFDDMLTWISRPILFNRMVAAGKLP